MMYSKMRCIFFNGREYKVLRLKKVLYGLKHAPRAWNARTDNYSKENGFR
jgi:hypothetical protein